MSYPEMRVDFNAMDAQTLRLGSARASRAGDEALGIANFSFRRYGHAHPCEVRFGEAPKPAREARALP
jgi:hypothetical protein